MAIVDRTGVIYNPLADRWQRSKDMDVNYMVLAEKDPAASPTPLPSMPRPSDRASWLEPGASKARRRRSAAVCAQRSSDCALVVMAMPDR